MKLKTNINTSWKVKRAEKNTELMLVVDGSTCLNSYIYTLCHFGTDYNAAVCECESITTNYNNNQWKYCV